MATWQFSTYLLPRKVFEARFGQQRENLPRDSVLDGGTMWTDKDLADRVLIDLSLILPEMTDYWDESGKAWGSHQSDIIEVLFEDDVLEEIFFRVDVGSANPQFVRSIVELARKHDLLLFTEGNSALSPELNTFVEALVSSRAARFIRDPEEFFHTLEQMP
jgi:hypothetical protein